MRLWYERGYMKKPPGYELQKMFSPTQTFNLPPRHEDTHAEDLKLLEKFYKLYPEVKYFPQGTQVDFKYGGVIGLTHPGSVFIKKQRDLMRQGYSEEKSFQIVEKDLHQFISKQKEEMRILRGTALNTFGESYLDRFQRIAEMESTLKVQRLERDIPKFLRSQYNWMETLNDSINQMNQKNENTQTHQEEQQKNEEPSYKRDTIEQKIQQNSLNNYQQQQKNKDKSFLDIEQYQPVLYQIVKHKEVLKDKEELTEMQEGFLQRSERLLKIFHQRSYVHDGLKNLTDKEVILQVRESPNKLKAATKSFLKKLKKLNVSLTKEGDVDYHKVTDKRILDYLKENEQMVKLALMQADLEFEYPQKLEKMIIKADLLKLVEEEELKLKHIAFQSELTQQKSKVLTYEDYYGVDITGEVQGVNSRHLLGSTRRDQKFEDYLAKNGSKYIFDNDLMEQSYKFWENKEEKYQRLKKIWLELQKKNALGGLEERTQEEQDELTTKIVDLLRNVRWRIDQELTKKNIDPIFKEHYRGYDKGEFLLDSDIEFFKIKCLLSKNPKLLKDDPLMALDYVKILDLIKRKKLLENSGEPFNPEDDPEHSYFNLEKQAEELERQKQIELDKLAKKQQEEAAEEEGANDLLQEEEEEQSVRSQKKKEFREKQKLLSQFQNLATAVQTKAQDVTQEGPSFKKKSKKKKEKSLSSKLRLKEKKGGPEKKS